MIATLEIFLLSTYAFWVLYMVYASFHTARKSGIRINRFSYVLFIPVLLVGYPLDIVWNTLFGSLLFLEVPWAESWRFWEWSFTSRCIRWKNYPGWRGRQSAFWASITNPFDANHI